VGHMASSLLRYARGRLRSLSLKGTQGPPLSPDSKSVIPCLGHKQVFDQVPDELRHPVSFPSRHACLSEPTRSPFAPFGRAHITYVKGSKEQNALLWRRRKTPLPLRPALGILSCPLGFFNQAMGAWIVRSMKETKPWAKGGGWFCALPKDGRISI
jgi:hypothetical protein